MRIGTTRGPQDHTDQGVAPGGGHRPAGGLGQVWGRFVDYVSSEIHALFKPDPRDQALEGIHRRQVVQSGLVRGLVQIDVDIRAVEREIEQQKGRNESFERALVALQERVGGLPAGDPQIAQIEAQMNNTLEIMAGIERALEKLQTRFAELEVERQQYQLRSNVADEALDEQIQGAKDARRRADTGAVLQDAADQINDRTLAEATEALNRQGDFGAAAMDVATGDRQLAAKIAALGDPDRLAAWRAKQAASTNHEP